MNSLPAQLREAFLQRWGDVDWDIAPPLHSGLSGIPLFRAESKRGVYAIRAWPLTAMSLHKISLWAVASNRFEELGDESDSPIPGPIAWSRSTKSSILAPSPYVLATPDWYWTLTHWVPGIPLSLTQVNDSVRGSLVEFLAHLHRTCRTIECTQARSLGMKERFDALQDRDWRPRISYSNRDFAIRYEALAQTALQSTNRWLGWLHDWSHRSVEQHWIVRDLWRENILVSSNLDRMWVVDLGASRVESPLFDFVRLIGSLHPTREEWERCVEQYLMLSDSKLPLSVDELWRLNYISIALSLRHWNRVLGDLNGRNDEWIAKAWERFGELVGSLKFEG